MTDFNACLKNLFVTGLIELKTGIEKKCNRIVKSDINWNNLFMLKNFDKHLEVLCYPHYLIYDETDTLDAITLQHNTDKVYYPDWWLSSKSFKTNNKVILPLHFLGALHRDTIIKFTSKNGIQNSNPCLVVLYHMLNSEQRLEFYKNPIELQDFPRYNNLSVLPVGKEYVYFSPKTIVHQPVYLVVNSSNIELTHIEVCYKGNVVTRYPKWLLNYLINATGSTLEIKGKTVISVEFLNKIPIKADLNIVTSDDEQELHLLSKEIHTFQPTFPLWFYQTFSTKVTGKCWSKKLNFELIGTCLVIHCESNVNNIIDVCVDTYLHYDRLLLDLYATRIDNRYLIIYFSHSPDDPMSGSINYNIMEGINVSIEWETELKDQPLHVASKNYNVTLMNENGLFCNQFSARYNELIEKYYSSFSVFQESENIYIEGYWYDGYNTIYPMPKPNSIPVDLEFVNKLENRLKSAIVVQYLGFSTCRICHKLNGSGEYILENDKLKFKVPEGFLHYIKEHNIHPSPKFYNFIMSW